MEENRRSPAQILREIAIIVAVSVGVIGFITVLHIALPAIGA